MNKRKLFKHVQVPIVYQISYRIHMKIWGLLLYFCAFSFLKNENATGLFTYSTSISVLKMILWPTPWSRTLLEKLTGSE